MRRTKPVGSDLRVADCRKRAGLRRCACLHRIGGRGPLGNRRAFDRTARDINAICGTRGRHRLDKRRLAANGRLARRGCRRHPPAVLGASSAHQRKVVAGRRGDALLGHPDFGPHGVVLTPLGPPAASWHADDSGRREPGSHLPSGHVAGRRGCACRRPGPAQRVRRTISGGTGARSGDICAIVGRINGRIFPASGPPAAAGGGAANSKCKSRLNRGP